MFVAHYCRRPHLAAACLFESREQHRLFHGKVMLHRVNKFIMAGARLIPPPLSRMLFSLGKEIIATGVIATEVIVHTVHYINSLNKFGTSSQTERITSL